MLFRSDFFKAFICRMTKNLPILQEVVTASVGAHNIVVYPHTLPKEKTNSEESVFFHFGGDAGSCSEHGERNREPSEFAHNRRTPARFRGSGNIVANTIGVSPQYAMRCEGVVLALCVSIVLV